MIVQTCQPERSADEQALDELLTVASQHHSHRSDRTKYGAFDQSCNFCIYLASKIVRESHSDRAIRQAQDFLHTVPQTADTLRSIVAKIDYLLHGASQ